MSIKTAIYKAINNSDICYRCEQSDPNLVSPCGNDECEARIHRECLTKQIEENNNVCAKCSRSIVSNKVSKLNLNECCKTLLNIFTVILMNIVGGANPLLIFGTLIDGRGIPSDIGGTFVLSIILSVFTGFGCLFWFIAIYVDAFVAKNDTFIKNQDIYAYMLIMAKIIMAVDGIILFCHFIGFFIMKYYYNSGNHFDCASFMYGFIIIVLALIALLITSGIIYGCKLLYDNNLKEVTVYGV